ncbi:MAG TPA: non-ribosomal peptide synthase/polyketide synthase, partial [Thermoanaerobaculia bacterium]
MSDGLGVSIPVLPFSNLVAALRSRAEAQPEAVAFTFLRDGEQEAATLTYGELDRRVRAVAAELQGRGAEGQRILLLFPPSLEFIVAFFGCLYARAVAVPVYPPRRRGVSRLAAIQESAEPALALTTPEVLARADRMAEEAPGLATLDWLALSLIPDEAAEDWTPPEIDEDTLAFLQYTSGSTSAPKGVMVSHGNLLANLEMIRQATRSNPESTYVSWLPMYHDMGLIGNVLEPLFVGARCVLMSPASFLQRPIRWLEAVSRYRAEVSGGPNFAYELCVRRTTAEERAKLDLRSWRVAFNGAEPVRAETLERFASAFEVAGFSPEAFFPCYGLAEATLIVTGVPQERHPTVAAVRGRELDAHRVVQAFPGSSGVRYLVGCGSPLLEGVVAIVDPSSRQRCGPGEVGEIWVAGPHVAHGYWAQPEETAHAFGAHLAGEPGTAFLRTGDLGFLKDGELFVTGRVKDLIIIRGMNHYPQDIELTMERQHPALRPGCGAAFAIDVDGEESLVVVQEVEPGQLADWEAVIQDIVEATAETHEVRPHAVVLIRAGSLPKTSSGKVQRFLCRRMFLDQDLQVVLERRFGSGDAPAPSAMPVEAGEPGSELEAWLTTRLVETLRVDARLVRPDVALSRYGLDSIAVIELAHDLEVRTGRVMGLSELLSSTIGELGEAVRRLHGAGQVAAAARPGAEVAAGDQPLSSGQMALWSVWRQEPESAAYNIAVFSRLSRSVDTGALHRAFERLLERHPMLRTTFREGDAGPLQRVGGLPASWFFDEGVFGSQEDLTELARGLARRSFDLQRGPLLRVHLLAAPGGERHLLLAVHHIAVDLWSAGILVEDLGALYTAEISGRPAALPALAADYGDHVRWQRELLAGPQGERQEAYWLRRLAGPLPAYLLPVDRPRTGRRLGAGEGYRFSLDAGLLARLRELGGKAGASLFMTLLAGWQALLARTSQHEDVIVGSPAAARSRAASAGVVGYFVNLLALRGDLGGGPGFAELVGRVRSRVLEAFENQDYPFPLIVERLGRERMGGDLPVVEVTFALQGAPSRTREALGAIALDAPGHTLRAGELALESAELGWRPAQFELGLMMAELGDEVVASLDYDPALLDRETVARLAARFCELLAGSSSSPERSVWDLPLLPERERLQVLVEWNETERSYERVRPVHELFSRQAAESPEAVALVDGGRRVSYGELELWSNRLAWSLAGLGVGPEQRVGIFLERSAAMVASILGVLKAGGAYVPLDPGYPASRVGFMLEDSDASVVVTDERLAAALPAGSARVVTLAELEESAASERPLPGTTTPQNLAYVIYTSGSTGRPKGVAVHHEGLSNLVGWHREAFGLTGADRSAHVAGLGFDASVWELWPPLTCGASLHLAPEAVRASAEQVWGWLESEGMTVAFLPTPLAEAVLGLERAEAAQRLRLLLTGGDRLRLPTAWTGDRLRLVNNYGPTECTVVGTSGEVRGSAGSLPSIGRPIANARAYAADRRGWPVGVGVPGELLLGGEGLARGYLGRPELTAEKFVPDPFGGSPGARLYRTGDLVRWRPDGELEFLGRTDHQVKVRGFRIEPGEIESVLMEHPGVGTAVVAARERNGETLLVAYAVPAAGASIDGEELRRWAVQRLPGSMVPSAFVRLEGLPLTASGKVDRGALPAPTFESGREARGEMEELLAGLWAEVLGVERVGPDDDFFALGGHSLLATRLSSRLRKVLGVEVPVRSLFEHPTVARLASELEGRGRSSAEPIAAVPRDGELALSFAQQRLWFLDQLEPGSPFYNIPAALRLVGDLDPTALAWSLSEVVRRHEVLRTSFPADAEGRPVQLVAAAKPLALPLVDLCSLESFGRREELARLAVEEARRPFDLGRGPLLRSALVRLGEREHALLLSVHHIVSDGWSMGILVRELRAAYESLWAGRAGELGELAIQYADFAAWQRQRLSGEDLGRSLEYWRERLSGLPVLELPSDRPRGAVQSFRGATRREVLAPSLTEAVRGLGRREGATLFMTLLASLQALLARYADQSDFAVGSPVAGRTHAETEGLIGFFVNTLVLRAQLDGEPAFRELLGRVREACLGAYAHQEVPFERLVEELAPERSLSRSPLFGVMLALEPETIELSLPELEVSRLEVETGTSRFDLTLSVGSSSEGLLAAVEYSTDLFDAARIERLLTHWRELLLGASSWPERSVWELPLLPEREREQVLVEWNETDLWYERGRRVHELFSRQASASPESVALVCGERRVSYGELERWSNRLAGSLVGLGVGPEHRVGIFLERSAEMVASILGVLKAGGAYVPLDPGYPASRVGFMLEDSEASVVVTEERLAAALPAGSARVVTLAELEESAVSERPLPGTTTPQNLAYVIYTSGSTGRPKGVAIEHRSAVALVAWAVETFRAEDLGGVLFSTSICFDLSIFELFVPLSRGGAVILAENALALPGLAAAEEVTLINTVPSALAELLRLGGVPGSVRVINLAGEPLPGALVRQAYGLGSVEAVWNLYGPSEDTTYSTAYRCAVADVRSPAIGDPIANTRAYVVDRRWWPVGVGVPGELLLGGEGLARGYLGRPELTAERFVPDPFGGSPGARLYRTGDLVRWRPDGELEFLGRTDHQVKVRGFRIELGEVEAVLRAHPAVREAVAVVRGDEAAGPRLVAYTVGATEPPVSAEELRAWLEERVPAYMVPSAFVVLESLPLTPSGKVDRGALPAPVLASGREALGAASGGARDQIEELLAAVWAEVLGLERVGIHDNFFEIGGHSLLATRVVSKIRNAFGVELPLRVVFERPTVAALAGVMRAAAAAEAGPIERLPRGGALPASFAQQRLWFLDRLEPGSPFYNVPVAARLCGELDPALLARCLAEVVQRHESLRTRFAAPDGQPLQVIEAVVEASLPVIDLAALPPFAAVSEAERLGRQEARRPFDLGQAPLWRAALLRRASADHTLLLTLHHIISDGWSMGVLVREVAALAAILSRGAPPTLPELPAQYADWATWQRRWLDGGRLADQLAYWRKKLAGTPVLHLPSDRPRPAVQSHRGGRRPFVLPADLAAGIAAAGRARGATRFMALLAAFQALLGRLSGQTDFAVGSPIAGRTRPETEGMIGLFVNTLALRADLAGEPTWGGLVARVREVCLEAYTNQDVPFERLVEELRPERSLAHAPIFQTMLTVQDESVPLRLPGLTVDLLPVDTGAAKLDLALSLGERDGALGGHLEHSADLLEAAGAERLLEQLGALLAAVVEDSEARLGDLPLLGETARHQLLVEWNDTAAASAACFPDLFARQVERTPEAPAVSCEGRTLSYAALAARAWRLAGALRDLGAGPDKGVAIFLERSEEVIVAILAAHAAGAFYAPLEPGAPRERLAAILDDVAPVAVVTRRALLAELPLDAVPAVCLDRDAAALEHRPASPPGVPVLPETLAYVIFTSGSTGRPKGVAVEHRQLASYVAGAIERLRLPAGAVYAVLSTFAADLGHTMVFPALTLGGCLQVVAGARVSDPAALSELWERQPADCLKIVPSHLAALLAGPHPERLLPRQRLVLGGEACDRALAARLRELAPACLLFNHYGPTETTVGVTTLAVSDPAALRGPTLPLGRPFTDTRLYVVDRGFQPLPIGVPGELLAAGEHVARGYLERPGLTAERFVPDPFGPPGSRLYRTGDLVRALPDGCLEFLGRIDQQVKIRGHRVEPAEVEAALVAHPGVAAAVVAARRVEGDLRLVAWLVPVGEAAPEARELRDWLAARLPEPMIPALFQLLAALPLTPNGKVDRAALPTPEAPAATAGGEALAPRTAVEELLAAAWAEVLGVERVGIHDDFFALGGHSLLATRLVSRVRKVLGVEVPVRSLFEHPTVARLASQLEGQARSSAEPIAVVPRDGELALSFAQQRLWFLDQLEPGSPFYNMPAALRLVGELRPAVLAQSLSEVVRRHEVLRTSFPADAEGRPVQVVAAARPLELPLVDLGGLESPVRQGELARLARAEARQPFDLGRGPLLRSLLVRLGEREHALLVTMHHIVSDGWSIAILVRELKAAYESLWAGRAGELGELAIQYADFAAWQRQRLSGEELERSLEHWRERLSGLPLLELPSDRPRGAVQSFRGATRREVLAPSLTEAVHGLGRREGATLFMTLLASFQVLLARYADQQDFAVGSPIAGRTHAETEDLIGFFVNTLVLRAQLDGEPTFQDLLGRVREACLGAYAHQEVPFERLVEELAPERSLSRSPLFGVMLALETEVVELSLPGLEVSRLEMETGTSRFDLTLSVISSPRGLTVAVEHSTDLFDAAWIERLITHWRELLAAASSSPERSVWDLPLLPERERRQLLAWNQTRTEYPREATIHGLFAEQAERTPDAVAVVGEEGDRTYRELRLRAGLLARRLRGLGVGPETPVGLCVERSPALIEGMLGILEAGGFYVPLDPAYPAERLRSILADTGARVLIADEKSADRLPSGNMVNVRVGREEPLPEDGSLQALPSGACADSLAYVMYTSGSTGTPKGVAIPHRAVVRLVRETGYARFGPEEVFLQLAPASFDASTLEIWGPLLHGGKLVLFPARNPTLEELAEVLSRHGVTTVWLTAGLFHQMVDEHLEGLRPVSQLLAGGDVLSPPHVRRVLEELPGCTLINGYGPTENTTFTCCRPLTAPEDVGATGAIGRPIANTRVHLLDRWLRPVPVGVPGELLTGGDGLARGYFGRPDLTAERFVPDPFGEGGRLYRTGDLTCWRPDGDIDFLGRIDQQVKIRGFRIEPAEVEAALARHPAVREAVVVARELAGGKALVAYVVAADAAPTAAELREALGTTLPAYMVPSAFVLLDALPLTPNGKVDRRALPAPDLQGPVEMFAAARTPTEELLAAVWAEVLGVERVGIHDDFFALGGHSLLATRLVSRLRKVLGVEVPVRSLFEHPTVAQLAEELEGRGRSSAEPIAAVPRDGALALSFAQQRLWFLDQLEPGSPFYNMPAALRLVGDLDPAALAQSLSEVVRRHEVLRTSFPADA